MAFLAWKSDFSVGVCRIDDEHKVLIEMINKGHDSIEDGNEAAAVAEICDQMRQYALNHFSAEEEMMRKHGFPDAKAHMRAHDVFRSRAVASQAMLGGGVDVDPIKTFKYLADWLRNHILGIDKELGAYLNEQGVS